jgi:chromosomal replication initiation ATPase DnaA
MTQHVPPDYQQLFHMRAKLARLRIQSAAIEREHQRRHVVNAIRAVVKHAPVIVTARAVLRYMAPIGPMHKDGQLIETPRTVAEIQAEVCAQLKVAKIDLMSQRRQADVVFARQFAMWRAKRETMRSLPEIGRKFGGRDHTTVLHAVRKMNALFMAGDLAKYGFPAPDGE